MQPHELRRAVEEGRATASELGLQVDDAVVIHNSDRVALHLIPCGVLARVAPVGHLADSEFEVEVARRLTDIDAPVAELDPRVEPRVHVRAAFAISLWTYYEPVGAEIAPADYADAFSRHHAALRQVDLDAPHFTERVAGALREVNDRARSPELHDADRRFLSDTLSGLSTAISSSTADEQLLHGEPHPGNLLNTRRGPLFVDLATCCRGPIEFDLAHAPEEVGQHYAGADQDLIHRCRALNWAMFSAWRWRQSDQMPDRDRRRAEGLDRVRAALDRC
ncbi:phosphotransferase family protein [Streptomyces sp. WI04-05B]|uniref:phosphotransferase n=1 Tax=Streptomyces TaxID=1883 RepID=UPI0029B6CCD8|nr:MULTISPECIES: phosphotransferase [unclassified Streptomyces]MDX2546445.1 aminoglycoside phosphotransferase family protein [Streptomyces sp. WI04-05B]MDX2586194.1 aminoglycoside phosphotransferase family protein [Streptomyces sp. WI04-05A]MDX3748845.1 aminoglycoside phosphotransferase family protein [Streptomyces sp. AK08-02]